MNPEATIDGGMTPDGDYRISYHPVAGRNPTGPPPGIRVTLPGIEASIPGVQVTGSIPGAQGPGPGIQAGFPPGTPPPDWNLHMPGGIHASGKSDPGKTYKLVIFVLVLILVACGASIAVVVSEDGSITAQPAEPGPAPDAVDVPAPVPLPEPELDPVNLPPDNAWYSLDSDLAQIQLTAEGTELWRSSSAVGVELRAALAMVQTFLEARTGVPWLIVPREDGSAVDPAAASAPAVNWSAMVKLLEQIKADAVALRTATHDVLPEQRERFNHLAEAIERAIGAVSTAVNPEGR